MVSAELDQNWLAKVQQSMRRSEYNVTLQKGPALPVSAPAYQAPNRAQNLRSYFTDRGVVVVPRTGDAGWRIMMRWADAPSRVEPAVEGNRVEYRHGVITEWFVNDDRGLEHGFTILEPVPSLGEGNELRLRLQFDGNVVARQAGDGIEIFTDGGQRIARYDALHAYDARNRELPARMLRAGNVTELRVDTRGASYPIRVDPLLSGTADGTLQANQESAQLGISVGAAGDVNGDGFGDVIVGANRYDAGQLDEGAAFIFHGSAAGIPSGDPATANTTLQSNQASALFGTSVAGAGDVNGDGYSDVIVGARFYDLGQIDEGAAFVFLGSATGVANGNPATANATLQSNQASANLGISVAGAGDVNGDGYADVIVGAFLYDLIMGGNEGAVLIFHGSAAGIPSGDPTSANRLLQSVQANGLLGISVAGAGDVNGDGYADVIAGASAFASGQANEGGAFVLLGSASGIPNAISAVLQVNQAFAEFGISVAGAGDVNGDGYADVIVGAYQYSSGESSEGAAFLYHGSATGIPGGNDVTAVATLQSNQGGARFGTSVAGAGDLNGDGFGDVIVGADAYDFGGTDVGAAFVFHGSRTGIPSGSPATASMTLHSNQEFASFGISVAGAGDINGDGYADVIVGASGYEAGLGEIDEGAAFVYLGGSLGIVNGTQATANATLDGSVAAAGDVNGDGYSDVIVAVLGYGALVFHGSATGIPSGNPATADTTLQSNGFPEFGKSVAGAGDVNGDGYADVIIGAEGAAFVFHGSATGITSGNSATANATLQSNQAVDFFGTSVAGAGDVNGDGYGDVIVGAYAYDLGQNNEGAAFLFHGSATGIASNSAVTPITATANTTLQSDVANVSFGISVAGAGDVNGDGYADVIVGASTYVTGAAFIFHGGVGGVPSGNPATANATLGINQPFSAFGISVAGAGDVNSDGYADVIVGADRYEFLEQTDEGGAFVFHGGATGVYGPRAIFRSNQANAYLGHSVAPAGDVNGDGYDDVIVGANNYDLTVRDGGAAFVFHGSGATEFTSVISAAANTTLQSNQEDNASFGISVAGVGDVNGDGYADVTVGAFVFLGNRGGRALELQQLCADDTRIPPWGFSCEDDEFRVRMTNVSARGRERVKLEVEACPAGSDFGTASCLSAVSAEWTDVTASSSGVPLVVTMAGLTSSTSYHWRARTLYAVFGVTQTGITASPKPAHSPWRRLSARSVEEDVRTPNAAPSITVVAPLGRTAASAGISETIATVSDPKDAAGTLTVTATLVPQGITVGAITNTSGTITATVAASCSAAIGANIVTLQVQNLDGFTATGDLTVNVSANTAPALGSYSDTNVAPGGSTTVTPSAAPADNGTVTVTASASVGFTGTVSANSDTGVVSISNANSGVHTITVTATDNCQTTATRSFSLDVVTVTPTGLVASASSGTTIALVWNSVNGADHYELIRNSGAGFLPIALPATNSHVDSVGLNTAHVYRVRAVAPTGQTSTFGNRDLATAIIFINDPLVAGSTIILAAHLSQIRTAVNAVRITARLDPAVFSDINPAGLSIKAVHITELRTALDAARSDLGLDDLSYTNALTGLQIRALDFTELRNGVR